ncbi:hypothetical protein SAMN05444285_1193 [Draconibacterium orientale]|uniref:Uncharacterized protein n=1 Tax=Draconibacterium orientale TaxID=1168034 RepID=X5DL70_9BACT|nr:hypothetical protein [Draconibacterium orientale]AHW62004.1 hypothetical protein FH5T_13050 [Draconibacterium orientale]SET65727.1 hypothetical protein SAMN05444285_1193 [Draconibacterium orientale]
MWFKSLGRHSCFSQPDCFVLWIKLQIITFVKMVNVIEMNAAEIKLDLFRRIDNLSGAQLKLVYNEIVSLLNAENEYNLTDEEVNAVEEALTDSQNNNVYSSDEVKTEAQKRYPNLKFK